MQSLIRRVEAQLESERERLALWLPVLFGLGIALWFVLPSKTEWIGALFTAAGLMLTGMMLGKQRRLGHVLIIGSGAFCLGLAYIWMRALYVAAPVLAYPVTTEFSAQIEAVQLQPARGKVRMLVSPIYRNDLPPLIRLTASEAQAPGLQPRDYIGVRARLTPPPQPSLPGGYDFARRAWFERLGAVGSVIGPIARVPAQSSTAGASIRARLTAHIHKQVDGGAGGVAAALVTGDRGAIPEADDEAMRRSGLAHLLSISGLHVTAVIGFTMLASLRFFSLFRRFALAGHVVPAAAGMAALVGGGYTMLAGAEVPTLRSFIAALLVLAAILLGRQAITLRLVAAGAALVMLWRPEALMGASFQLSFAAVASIIALHELPKVKAFLAPRDEGLVGRLRRSLIGLALTGFVVEFALMPIGLFHFHKSGIYGALANMIAIPLTTFVIMPAEALALAFDAVGLGRPFWWIAEGSLRFLIGLAHLVAETPGSVRTMPEMPLHGFALIMMGGIWLLIWQRHWRLWGSVPVLAGIILIWLQPQPDLLVSRDGNQIATRVSGDVFAMLRMSRTSYSYDMMMEAAGSDSEAIAIKNWSKADCNADFCRWDQPVSGKGEAEKTYRILASRSRRFAEYEPLIAACQDADIVISGRRLPKGCVPKMMKLDKLILSAKGGAILHLDMPPEILNTQAAITDHPWHHAEQVSGNDEM